MQMGQGVNSRNENMNRTFNFPTNRPSRGKFTQQQMEIGSIEQSARNNLLSQDSSRLTREFDEEIQSKRLFSPQTYTDYINIYTQSMKRDLMILKQYRIKLLNERSA